MVEECEQPSKASGRTLARPLEQLQRLFATIAMGPCAQTGRVHTVYGFGTCVHIEIRSPGKHPGILARPPPGAHVVVPRPEPHQPARCVPQPTHIPEGLEPRVRVQQQDRKSTRLNSSHLGTS